MFTSEQAQQLGEVVTTAQTVLVVLPTQPTLDQTATALALTSALETLQKQVTVITPQPLVEPLSQLAGADLIQNQIGNRDLAVSFAYTPEAVDKVSYHIDEAQQRFYLVIKPQKGHKPIDQTTVDFSYTGAEADIVFLIGVHSFDSLEHLYFGYEQLYQTAVIVTFHTFQPEIGTFKLDASGTSSLSESVTLLLQQTGWTLTPEAATNLLQAIEQATDHFQSLSTSAETFEVTAWLMRAGARRSKRVSLRPVENISIPVSLPTEINANNANKKNKSRKNGTGKMAELQAAESAKAGSLKYQPTGFGPGGNG